jgi:hypothetical protein
VPEVVIVATTVQGSLVCVGALDASGSSYRLHEQNGWSPVSGRYEVGQRWSVEGSFHPGPAPFREDYRVTRARRVGVERDLAAFARRHARNVWDGPLSSIFDGCLTMARRPYLASGGCLPPSSTGFWVSDRDSTREEVRDGFQYSFDGHRLVYKGTGLAPPRIARGSVLRVSLARWWAGGSAAPFPDGPRCFTQLSAAYLPADDGDSPF